MRLTRHAERRSNERRVPRDVIRLIHDFGTTYRSGGAEGLKLDRTAIDLASEGDHRLRADLRRYRGAYVIMSDEGTVITVARETRRHRR